MPNSLDKFAEEFNKTIAEISKFLYLTRDDEFKAGSIKLLEVLRGKCELFKQKAINIQNEDLANSFLTLEIICEAFISELNMWLALKNDDAKAAWDYLITAQYAMHTAIHIHEIAELFSEHEHRLSAIEQVVFPPQSFVSTGSIVKKSICTICKQDYEECDHEKGKAYMGQVCARGITVAKLTETSVVSDPADKRCRIFSFTDDGKQRDIMTWRIIGQ